MWSRGAISWRRKSPLFRFAKKSYTLSVRPHASGDPGAKHANVSTSGSPRPRGRTENVALSVVTYSVVKEPVRCREIQKAKENRPLFAALGQGVARIPLFFRHPRKRGGRRADKAHCPDCSGRGVRIAPDDEVHCDAPRAL